MDDKRLLWKVVGTVSGLAAGMATKSLLRVGWRRLKGSAGNAHGGQGRSRPSRSGSLGGGAMPSR